VNLNDGNRKSQRLEQMLDGDDLKKEGKILSLPASTFIDHVAEKKFGICHQAPDQNNSSQGGFLENPTQNIYCDHSKDSFITFLAGRWNPALFYDA
jgi:hypothetical protein